MDNKVYLTLSDNYVKDWGFWEAARELIANAKDAGGGEIETFRDRDLRWMSIKSQGGKIPKEFLLLGNSSNRDSDDSIGTHGEGAKLAMLVLVRGGYQLRIKNGFDRWNVTLENHPQLGAKCLCVEITEGFYNIEDTCDDIVDISIHGLTDDDAQILDSNYLPDNLTDWWHSANILLDFDGCQIFRYGTDICAEDRGSLCDKGSPKKVFVNGLFVCDLPDDYVFSYNLTPDRIELDRDRRSVDTWDLQREVADLLESAGEFALMVQMSEEKVPDLFEYYTPSSYRAISSCGETRESSVSEKLQVLSKESFVKKNGVLAVAIDATLPQNKRSIIMNRVKLAGKTPIEVPKALYKLLPEECTALPKTTHTTRKTPVQLAEAFLEGNKRHMRGKAKRELINMIEELTLIA